MSTTTIASRPMYGRTPEGRLVRAVAKLHHLAGNDRPYFSFTTSRGCAHDDIAAAFPSVVRFLALHLADDAGVPMHAVANAGYQAERGDAAALARHLGTTRDHAEAIVGRVACIPADPETAEAARAEHDDARERAETVVKKAARAAKRYQYGESMLYTAERTRAAYTEAVTARDALDLADFMADVVRRRRASFIAGAVNGLRLQWAELAAACRAWLHDGATACREGTGTTRGLVRSHGLTCYPPAPEWREPDAGDLDDLDDSTPCAVIDGRRVAVEVRREGRAGEGAEFDDGDRQYVVFPSVEVAGDAARAYWADLAANDPAEFACMVGTETLTAWALGQLAGPGSEKVRGLPAWLDLYATPTGAAEHYASWDGKAATLSINSAAAKAAGFTVDGAATWATFPAYRRG